MTTKAQTIKTEKLDCMKIKTVKDIVKRIKTHATEHISDKAFLFQTYI